MVSDSAATFALQILPFAFSALFVHGSRSDSVGSSMQAYFNLELSLCKVTRLHLRQYFLNSSLPSVLVLFFSVK